MNESTSGAIGQRAITIGDICHIAQHSGIDALASGPEFEQKIQRGADFLNDYLAHNGVIYGVTTGYGDSCTVNVPEELVLELPAHLTRYHGCGLGRYLSPEQTRATIATRMNSLALGVSGVRLELLQQLNWLLQNDVLPLIPEEGSVGASGDLTPLSYIAAALIGERDVLYRGEVRPAIDVYRALDRAPLRLAPKEGLAIMNGTSVMTALACLAFERAEYLTRLSARLTALASIGLRGNRNHFDPRLFAVKPHQGQQQIADWIWQDLLSADNDGPRLQDRYSVRCAPHVIGVLRDGLSWMRRDIENELNSANDNPIIDPDNKVVLHGGHFYGGHICFVMDAMKNAVANLADLMDRQMALLVDSRYNHGLPQNLSGARGMRSAINHGFKAVQISMSAWTAEALKLTMPASVFSRSTECHNQDKVSMGTIAARDCLRVLELTEQVAAAHLMACVQSYDLRVRSGEIPGREASAAIQQSAAQLRELTAFVDEDRPLEHDLRRVVAAIQAQVFALYPQ